MHLTRAVVRVTVKNSSNRFAPPIDRAESSRVVTWLVTLWHLRWLLKLPNQFFCFRTSHSVNGFTRFVIVSECLRQAEGRSDEEHNAHAEKALHPVVCW